jgi:hypothetical protein
MAKKVAPNSAAWSDFLSFCGRQRTSQEVYRGLGSVDFELVPKIGRVSDYSKEREKNVFLLFEKRAQLYHSLYDWRWLNIMDYQPAC